ncbi:MAG: hypothetical protein Q8878_04565 [Bacillota bacterium]|nr:hypothetical protein [Bacillota bacterium]
MKNTEKCDTFDGRLSLATESLRSLDFDKAYELITDAIKLNPDAPEPHNLLGIWFELKGQGDKARKHYRAAYALDPTFKPACRNLEHICTTFDYSRVHTYDFGDQPENE